MRQDVDYQGERPSTADTVVPFHAEHVQQQLLPLPGPDAKPLAGAEHVPRRIEHLHPQPGSLGRFEQGREIHDLVPCLGNRLGGYSESVIGFFTARHNRLRLVDQVYDGAQVAGRLGRVVGDNARRVAENQQNAIAIGNDNVQCAIVVDIRHVQINRGFGVGNPLGWPELDKLPLVVKNAGQDNDFGITHVGESAQ